MKALPIQAVGLVYQAATATPVVSATMEATDTGGLLQSLVPAHGYVSCSTTTAVPTATTPVETTAFLLVASGMIKVCVHQVIVSDI